MSAMDRSGGIPDKGKMPPDKGKMPPDKGKMPPDKGKMPPDKGKAAAKGQAVLGEVTSGAACVVLRASVETFGPAGDAELNLNVKWPAAALAAASEFPTTSTTSEEGDVEGIDASGNLHLPATNPISTRRG
jgi:hypothetical protein